MTEQEQAMWGSHLPALLTAIGASKGPVLEVGVGHFSTPALHAICGAMGRKLVSVEKDLNWLVRFADQYSSPMHEFLRWPGEKSLYQLLIDTNYYDVRWGVVFIDHSPGGASRAEPFERLAPHASYVVVHDYHLENEEHIAPLLKNFKTARLFNSYQPPTLVASLNYELPECADQL